MKEALIINRNFKVSPVVDAAIDADSRELGLSVSEFLRLCVYLGGQLLLRQPALANLDRQQLAELAANISKMLVIRPLSVALKGNMEG